MGLSESGKVLGFSFAFFLLDRLLNLQEKLWELKLILQRSDLICGIV